MSACARPGTRARRRRRAVHRESRPAAKATQRAHSSRPEWRHASSAEPTTTPQPSRVVGRSSPAQGAEDETTPRQQPRSTSPGEVLGERGVELARAQAQSPGLDALPARVPTRTGVSGASRAAPASASPARAVSSAARGSESDQYDPRLCRPPAASPSRPCVSASSIARQERAEPFVGPPEMAEGGALRHEGVGDDRHEIGVLGRLEDAVGDLDRPRWSPREEVAPGRAGRRGRRPRGPPTRSANSSAAGSRSASARPARAARGAPGRARRSPGRSPSGRRARAGARSPARGSAPPPSWSAAQGCRLAGTLEERGLLAPGRSSRLSACSRNARAWSWEPRAAARSAPPAGRCGPGRRRRRPPAPSGAFRYAAR